MTIVVVPSASSPRATSGSRYHRHRHLGETQTQGDSGGSAQLSFLRELLIISIIPAPINLG